MSMQLLTLSLRNFRNIEKTTIDFCAGLNVIWGDNAQGKSNFLEALYLLGNGKSFRRAQNEQLVKNSEAGATIEAGILAATVHHEIRLSIDERGKDFCLNGKGLQGIEDLVSINRQILFSPDEVGIAKGSPAGRRNLIDRAIFLARPPYLKHVQDYNRILKQRNRLLKEKRDQAQIDPWSAALVNAGALIRWQRQQFVQEFRPYLQDAYRHLSVQKESADLFLEEKQASQDATRDILHRELERLSAREKRLCTTLGGPHRDDPVLVVDGLDLRRYGSQGQQRCFILAFKAALVHYLEERVAATPILLLDDISSELDKQRRQAFFSYLLERGGQVFVTTTDPEAFEGADPKEARYFKVVDGRIFPEQRKLREL